MGNKFVVSHVDVPVGRANDPLFEFVRDELKKLPADKALRLPLGNFDGCKSLTNRLTALRAKLQKAFPNKLVALSKQDMVVLVWFRAKISKEGKVE